METTIRLTRQKGIRHNVTHSMKRPPAITVQLIHIHGPMKGEIQEFSKETISIGRHPSSDLRLPTDLTIISRKHAEIIREGNQFRLIDRSTNGTFVNGKKITETLLRDGDVLEFADGGPKVSFLTQMKEMPVEAETAPPPLKNPGPFLPHRSRRPPRRYPFNRPLSPSSSSMVLPSVLSRCCRSPSAKVRKTILCSITPGSSISMRRSSSATASIG